MGENNSTKSSQFATFRYSQEATSQSFNQLLCDLLPCGIYKGGELSLPESVDDATLCKVNIAPLVCFIKSSNALGVNQDNVALRFQMESTSVIVGQKSADHCYIVLRCTWKNEEASDVVSVRVVKKGGSNDSSDDKILDTDIVLGRVYLLTQDNGKLAINRDNPFDLTCRQDVYWTQIKEVFDYFDVTPTDTPSNTVHVTGGFLNSVHGRVEIKGRSVLVPDIGVGKTRIDLIAVTQNNTIECVEGEEVSLTQEPSPPNSATLKPLAEIRRRGACSTVTGRDIFKIYDKTVISNIISAKDIPVSDNNNLLPKNVKRNTEDVLSFLSKSIISIHQNDSLNGNNELTLKAVRNRNINWGTDRNKGEIDASCIPIKDEGSVFEAGTVEEALNEIAGVGREKSETLSGLSDKIVRTKTDINDEIAYLNTKIENHINKIGDRGNAQNPHNVLFKDLIVQSEDWEDFKNATHRAVSVEVGSIFYDEEFKYRTRITHDGITAEKINNTGHWEYQGKHITDKVGNIVISNSADPVVQGNEKACVVLNDDAIIYHLDNDTGTANTKGTDNIGCTTPKFDEGSIVDDNTAIVSKEVYEGSIQITTEKDLCFWNNGSSILIDDKHLSYNKGFLGDQKTLASKFNEKAQAGANWEAWGLSTASQALQNQKRLARLG